MTTGNITIGAPKSPKYYSKVWSGGDGRGQENAYTMDLVVRSRGASKLVPYPAFPADYYADASGYGSLGLTWTANDTIAHNAKFASRYKGHEFNLGVAVGEGRETANMVKETAKSIGKSILSLKKGRPDDALRHLIRSGSGRESRSGSRLNTKDISSQWLAIQYGWKPLLNDVYNSAKAFEHHSAAPRSRKLRVSHTIRRTGNTSTSPSNWYGHGKGSHTKKYTVTITEDLTNAPRALGLLNPLQVAWELVPFSFVADWFIPVGDYLEAVSATPPHYDIFVTLGEKIVYEGRCSSADIINTGMYHSSGFTFTDKTVHVERSPGHAIATPAPKFKDLKDAYNVDRAKNAVALLHQLFT